MELLPYIYLCFCTTSMVSEFNPNPSYHLVPSLSSSARVGVEVPFQGRNDPCFCLRLHGKRELRLTNVTRTEEKSVRSEALVTSMEAPHE